MSRVTFLDLERNASDREVKFFPTKSVPISSESETALKAYQLIPIPSSREINQYRFRSSDSRPTFGRVPLSRHPREAEKASITGAGRLQE